MKKYKKGNLISQQSSLCGVGLTLVVRIYLYIGRPTRPKITVPSDSIQKFRMFLVIIERQIVLIFSELIVNKLKIHC